MRYTHEYKSLPYNPALHDEAKKLRKAGMLHEVSLWNELKSKKLNRLDFVLQKIIGNCIVDFYCAEKANVMGVDGASHDEKQSEGTQRETFLKGLGLQIIRIFTTDVLQNIEEVMAFLSDHTALEAPLRKGGADPHNIFWSIIHRGSAQSHAHFGQFASKHLWPDESSK